MGSEFCLGRKAPKMVFSKDELAKLEELFIKLKNRFPEYL